MHWSDSFISSACVCWLKLSSACGIERERDRERDSIWLHSSSALSLLHIIPAAATCVFVERFSSSHFFALHPVVEMTFVNKSVEQEKSWEMWSKTLSIERVRHQHLYTHTRLLLSISARFWAWTSHMLSALTPLDGWIEVIAQTLVCVHINV
jgi:hypothetical protein